MDVRAASGALLSCLALSACSGATTASGAADTASGGSDAAAVTGGAGLSGQDDAAGVDTGAGGSAYQGGPISWGELPSVAPMLICSGFGACCSSKGYAFSQATCELAARRAFVPTTCPPGTVYDPQAAASCYAGMKPALAACTRSTAEVDAACRLVCAGQVSIGGTCMTSEQCAQPATGSASCQGTQRCALDVHLTAGAPCGDTCDIDVGDVWTFCSSTTEIVNGPPGNCRYNEGLYCGPSGTCEPTLAEGKHCTKPEACGPTTYCSSAGVCTPRLADGEACVFGDGVCLGTCDMLAARCAAVTSLGAVTAKSCTTPSP